MDGFIERGVDRQSDGWMNSEWMDEWKKGWTNGLMDRWTMYGWKNRQMDGQLDEDEWVDGQMDIE